MIQHQTDIRQTYKVFFVLHCYRGLPSDGLIGQLLAQKKGNFVCLKLLLSVELIKTSKPFSFLDSCYQSRWVGTYLAGNGSISINIKLMECLPELFHLLLAIFNIPYFLGFQSWALCIHRHLKICNQDEDKFKVGQ